MSIIERRFEEVVCTFCLALMASCVMLQVILRYVFAAASPWAEEIAARTARIPGARIDVKPFALGPAVDNPVGFRLIGDDPDVLRDRAREMIALMRASRIGSVGSASVASVPLLLSANTMR